MKSQLQLHLKRVLHVPESYNKECKSADPPSSLFVSRLIVFLSVYQEKICVPFWHFLLKAVQSSVHCPDKISVSYDVFMILIAYSDSDSDSLFTKFYNTESVSKAVSIQT